MAKTNLATQNSLSDCQTVIDWWYKYQKQAVEKVMEGNVEDQKAELLLGYTREICSYLDSKKTSRPIIMMILLEKVEE